MENAENKEAFFARLTSPPYGCMLAPEDLVRIELAYLLAKYGHRAQTRKEEKNGKPERYFEHPRRVALILLDELRLADPPMIMAALLHDCFEDTRDIDPLKVQIACGPDVVRLVRMLSKTPKAGYYERLIEHGDWRALMIKACDRLDNLRTLEHTDDAFIKKQVGQTREEFMPVLGRLADIAPFAVRDKAGYASREIEKLLRGHEERLAASLAPVFSDS